MNEYPNFNLVAVPHKDIGSASRVFSSYEIEHFLFVKVDSMFARDYELYQVHEVVDDVRPVCCKRLWEHDPGRPWYRFESARLNLGVGYHCYRLSFVNTRTNNTSVRYIAYAIQSADADKPYMYMDDARRFLDDVTNNC